MKKKHWKQHVTTVILSATLFLVLIFMSGKLGMVAYASDKISGEVGTLKWYLEEQKDVVDEKEQVETAPVSYTHLDVYKRQILWKLSAL